MYEDAELVEETVTAPRSSPSPTTLLERILEKLKNYW